MGIPTSLNLFLIRSTDPEDLLREMDLWGFQLYFFWCPDRWVNSALDESPLSVAPKSCEFNPHFVVAEFLNFYRFHFPFMLESS